MDARTYAVSVVGLVFFFIWIVFFTVLRVWYASNWSRHDWAVLLGTGCAFAAYAAAVGSQSEQFSPTGVWHWPFLIATNSVFLYHLARRNHVGVRRATMLWVFLVASTGVVMGYRAEKARMHASCSGVFVLGNVWPWLSLYLSFTLWGLNDNDFPSRDEMLPRARLSAFMAAQVFICMTSAFGQSCGGRLSPGTEAGMLLGGEILATLCATDCMWERGPCAACNDDADDVW